MKYLVLILAIIWGAVCTVQAQDLEYPSGPSDYRSGFFGASYTGLGDTAYENWIDPGNEFCRVRFNRNCDGSTASPAEISGAKTTWSNLTQCRRWRIRLAHVAELKWIHITNPKIAVYYSTAIPASKKDQIISCLVPSEFEFLGQTFSTVCTKLDARATDLCAKFWPGVTNIPAKQMNPVVLGWEGDAE